MTMYDHSYPPVLEAAATYRDLIAATHSHVLRDGTIGTFSERHVQCIWYDPALRPQTLHTRNGEQVVVLDPGRWNREAGPDFSDATLLIKPELRRIQGDVEIHIHPADWEHHGHADDPRYRRVIAHITFFPSLEPPARLPPGTLEIALASALKQNPAFRMQTIDTNAYPFAARLQQCACGILLKEHTNIDPTTLLYTAGCYRFEQKIHAMTAALKHCRTDDLLYHQTMCSLGYKQNSKTFAQLAQMAPFHTISQRSPLEAYAILMGTAGLLPATLPTNAPAENKKFVRQLWDIWWQQRPDTAPPITLAWKGPAGRPANQPARRLAAAAALFTRAAPWQQVLTASLKPKSLAELRTLFTPPPPLDFWRTHTTLEQPTASTNKALMGKDRLAAWLNNVVLPLAAAAGTKPQTLLPLYRPEQINAIVRQTANRLLGRDHNPALYRNAGILQHGLLQIFQDFCSKGCHDCALADALRKGAFNDVASRPTDWRVPAPPAPQHPRNQIPAP